MPLKWIKSKHTIEINTKLNTYAYWDGKEIDKVIIFLHGYGDNAENASQIAPLFRLSNTLFLFIEGQQKVSMSFGGFQWFDLFHESHKKIDASALLILDLFKHLTFDHNIPKEKIFFSGFSQGASMALYCGLKTKENIGGIIAVSGFIIHCADLLSIQETLNKNCPLLLIHGNEDHTIFPVLFFETQEILKYLGFKNILAKIYPMGHTISSDAMDEIKKFLT